jgi:hypothetical protein
MTQKEQQKYDRLSRRINLRQPVTRKELVWYAAMQSLRFLAAKKELEALK